MKIPWWVFKAGLWEVPIFMHFGFISPIIITSENWYCAREQLWAMREGLA